MTVAELKELLNELNDNDEIYIEGFESEYDDIGGIRHDGEGHNIIF